MAIFHDFFSSFGGGEKVVLMLAKKYKADIFTYFFDKNKTFKELEKFNIIQHKFPIRFQFLKQILAKKFFADLNIEESYDIFLFYGFYSIFAAKNNHPNIWLAAAPPKNLFLPEYYKTGNLLRKFGMNFFRGLVLRDNLETVRKHLDVIFAVSKFQEKNIRKIYRRERNVKVIYPPVETKKFYFKSPEDYYLTVSRLEPLKRVDLIIEAFKRMPEKKLVIVGDGSQRKYLERLASGRENIEFKGAVYGKELIDLYAKCIAFIFMSKLEDFGIVPVEAMAAGKPVIGANEGGIKETIIHNKTGLLVNPDVKSIIKSVEIMKPEVAAKMRKNCEKRATLFDEEKYFKKVDKEIKELHEKCKEIRE